MRDWYQIHQGPRIVLVSHLARNRVSHQFDAVVYLATVLSLVILYSILNIEVCAIVIGPTRRCCAVEWIPEYPIPVTFPCERVPILGRIVDVERPTDRIKRLRMRQVTCVFDPDAKFFTRGIVL
jgi:hypothetical protein